MNIFKEHIKLIDLRYDEVIEQRPTHYVAHGYDHIELVGFRLEDGQYFPTKVFVSGNFGVGKAQLERLLFKYFSMGVFTGGAIAMATIVVMVMR
jgi:hypothetical protein